MKSKSTGQLINEISEATDIIDYLGKNQENLLTETLIEFLDRMLKEKLLSKAEAIEASDLNQIYGYQIFSGQKNPSRDKLIALSFGLKLSLTEVQQLLRTAFHRQLYPRDKRDALLIYAFENQLNIIQTNELLYDNHFDVIK